MAELDKDDRLVQENTVGVVRLNKAGTGVEAGLYEKKDDQPAKPTRVGHLKKVEIHG
ncbi:MAG: hypothetical protein ACYS14_12090 [Planctomycetota bacterium]|jgi:hypothetical protein